MSVRWMAVQYLGNTLRLPVTNECDLHKPFGVSKLERDVERIIVNPFSDARRTFVPVDANMEQENEKLQNRLELLLTILRENCDLNVSWDGLRGFWNVELTEGGCLMRDRACKAEAENEKLRELLHDAQNELKKAEDELGRDLMNSATVLLGIRMRESGIEVDE